MTSGTDALQQAVRLLQAGRPNDAELVLTGLLQASPGDAEALALLGLVFAQRDENERAADVLAQALAANPSHLSAHVNCAKVLTRLARWAEVAGAAGRALALRPDHAEARRLRGHAFAELNRTAEALADLDAIATASVATILVRAKLRHNAGRAADAVADYDRIIELEPANWEALNNRGIALENLQRHEEALASYERALTLNPMNASVLHNCAASLLTLRRHEEALPLFRHLIEAEPASVENWTGHGAALASLVRLEESLASFTRALELNPTAVRALVGRGTVLAALGRSAEAKTDYRKALAIDPNNATAHANLAFALLADGDLEAGFAEYEWRRKVGPIHLRERRFAAPEWQGEELGGRTLLLHPEQGLGDIIQYARFVPHLTTRGARVVLEVPATLEALMRTFKGNTTIVRAGAPQPSFDLHAPLMSLGHKLGLALDNIPADVPYLYAPADRQAAWSARMTSLARPRVGLCWSGNAAHSNNRARSIPLEQFSGITSVSGVSFVNLQREIRASDASAFAALRGVTDAMSETQDLADTAALIAELDLVICVDTSVAHLAGALGKPVWILIATSADWRWLKHREDSAWYPSARLFRQTEHGRWLDVIQRVRVELSARFTGS